MEDIQSNKFLIKTPEVENAQLILKKVSKIKILEHNKNSITVSSENNLNFNLLVKILNNKIPIQSIKEESRLIDFF